MDPDSIRNILEDALKLATAVKEYDGLDEGPADDAEEFAALRNERICELVIDIAERLGRVSGIRPEDVWLPAGLSGMVEWEVNA